VKLTLNGEPHDHAGVGTIPALAAEIGAELERVAVMVNGDIVPRRDFAALRLSEGDTVEIITFAGGG